MSAPRPSLLRSQGDCCPDRLSRRSPHVHVTYWLYLLPGPARRTPQRWRSLARDVHRRLPVPSRPAPGSPANAERQTERAVLARPYVDANHLAPLDDLWNSWGAILPVAGLSPVKGSPTVVCPTREAGPPPRIGCCRESTSFVRSPTFETHPSGCVGRFVHTHA